jgi:hypothetical protein
MTGAAQTLPQHPQLLLQRLVAGRHACHTGPLLLRLQHMRQAVTDQSALAGRLRCIGAGVVAALW